MSHLSPWLLALLVPLSALAQKADTKDDDADKDAKPWSAATFKGMELRSVGPAFYTGRIADVAINPKNESEYYVAVGSGGVWKTENAGVTFKPVFDKQKVFSIGSVTIDTSNPSRVWVGTGENAGGRHFSWGDGIYLSEDAGAHWKNMGLRQSEHISKIIIHPDSSNVVWVAAQGPLWSKGGQRGVYKSSDGGKSWRRTLGNDEWTGATDLLIDPRQPNHLIAATWDRHRTVAAYMGGGPGSGIHRSTDGGLTWTKLTEGLPKETMGKIGLAMSPQNPDVLYAAIELPLLTGGVYRSEDQGASWHKMSDKISGGTGPHYYQELYPSPHAFDRIYFANNNLQISEDGGKTWRSGEAAGKHVDNHAVAFRQNDPNYLMVGTDGGLYESFDLGKTFRHFGNMPITQFYKIAVDDAEPFYNIYGGTQDNSTQGGPSRTDNNTGIQNGDWRIVNGGDGHQPATEPGNPDIIYAQSQQGYLNRIDMRTGEHISIRPQPDSTEGAERYNWDAPILVSPHSPQRLYFASQRLWKSDDRGDNWTAISGDLTRDQDRLALPIMGRQQGYTNNWDLRAMSNFNSITSVSESPLEAGRLYVGTDDGIIATTTDGGKNWTRKEVGSIKGVPARAFVNDIKADLYDVNTAYVSMDNHKEGDYRPFVYKTTDGGKSWNSIIKGLPDTTLAWRLVQDYKEPNLLFLGTEFGLYFSVDGGGEWLQLKGGLPPIAIRDLAIQRREDDLVAATFGRSIYVLDDYSPLREVTKALLEQPAALLPMRDADLYDPRDVLTDGGKGSIGSGHYAAKNPDFGAVMTYYLKEGFESAADLRKKREKALNKAGRDIAFPGYDSLEMERLQDEEKLWFTIEDSSGRVVRRLEAPAKKGIHRLAWDLRRASLMPIDADALMVRGKDDDDEGSGRGPRGPYVEPGTYQVTMVRMQDGRMERLAGPMQFAVKPLREGSLPARTPAERRAFTDGVEQSRGELRLQSERLKELKQELRKTTETIIRSGERDIAAELFTLRELMLRTDALEVRYNGEPSRTGIGERGSDATVGSRLGEVSRGAGSGYGPTGTAEMSLQQIDALLVGSARELSALESAVEALNASMKDWVKPRS